MLLPHLETNVTLACQLKCVGCNHFTIIRKSAERADPDQIGRDLTALGKVARTAIWAALGGEPLLHPQLVEILDTVRATGVADMIEVWSNGLLLRKQGPRFWQSFDKLVVSVYPDKLTDEDLLYIYRTAKEHGRQIEFKDARGDGYFRTLLYERLATEAEARAIYQGCWYRTYCHVVDWGYFYRCCTSPFVPPLILGLPKGTDGIPLEGLTEERLAAYLHQEQPPASCYRCAGHNGPPIAWKEATSRATWLAESVG